jgi:hypothetical protein
MESASFTFAAEPVDAVVVREWGVARTEQGDHRITIRHATPTVFSCDRLDGELMRHGRDLTLRVQGSGEPRPSGAEVYCRYTAVIDGMASGRYSLRVVHTRVTSGNRAKTVFNHPIHIP